MAERIVSVIVPSFNQAGYLRATIESVLGQVGVATEVIVVDGGSTDGSVEVIREFEDRLAWWVSEPDDGQSDAIMKGARRATGDIITWLNSDDTYEPGALSKVVNAFDSHPEAAAVYGDYYVLWPDGRKVLKKKIDFDWDICVHAYMMTPQPATFFARWAWDLAGGVDVTLTHCMDYDLVLKVGRLGPFFHLHEPLACFRLHPQSKTATARGHFRRENRLVRERALGRRMGAFDALLERYYLAKAVWRFYRERGEIVWRRSR